MARETRSGGAVLASSPPQAAKTATATVTVSRPRRLTSSTEGRSGSTRVVGKALQVIVASPLAAGADRGLSPPVCATSGIDVSLIEHIALDIENPARIDAVRAEAPAIYSLRSRRLCG